MDKNAAGGTGYVCDVCGDTFESAAALKRHIRERGLVT